MSVTMDLDEVPVRLAGHVAGDFDVVVVAGAIDDHGRDVIVVGLVGRVGRIAVHDHLAAAAGLQGFLRGDAGEQRVGVRLEGGEIDLIAFLDRVGEVFEAEVELGGGDFLAAFLFGDFRVVAADGGELGFGGFDGL